MEFNESHKEILLKELVKTSDKIKLGKLVMESNTYETNSDNFKAWCEVTMFLLEEEFKLIESSLNTLE